jgi:excinuclease ABC subunit A
MAPIVRGRKGEYKKELQQMQKSGFIRARIDGTLYDLSQEIQLQKNKKHTIEIIVDRLTIKDGVEKRLADSLELALKLTQGVVLINQEGVGDSLYSERLACIDCGVSYPELTPRIFSFNSPHGACPECDGLGTKMDLDPGLIVSNPDLSIREGAIRPWEKRSSVFYYQMLESLAQHYGFDLKVPFNRLTE